MLGANLTTFDHVFGLTAGTSPALSLDTVANALQWAITYNNTLTADQVGAAVSAALADGALTAAQAMTLVIDWADTGVGTVATLAGQVMAAAVATHQITADAGDEPAHAKCERPGAHPVRRDRHQRAGDDRTAQQLRCPRRCGFGDGGLHGSIDTRRLQFLPHG